MIQRAGLAAIALLALGLTTPAAATTRPVALQAVPAVTPSAPASPSGVPSTPPRAAPTPTAPPLPPAGIVPPSLVVSLTGDPAEPHFVRAAIEDALTRAIAPTLQPGARAQVGAMLPASQAIDAGSSVTFSVFASIVGPNLARVDGAVNVTVDDVEIPRFMPPFLRFDDDPEYIRGDGVLFRGMIAVSSPQRIYYYHANTGTPRRFLVGFSATSDAPARIQLIDAPGGPDPDVMGVGHTVTRTFLLAKPRNEGRLLELARSRFWFRDASLGATDGIAGAMDVRVLSGGPVEIEILAIPPNADPASYLGTPDLPGDGHDRHGTFVLQGYGETVIAYSAGGPDASLTYGDREPSVPNIDPRDSGRDIGDYGVLRSITFDLDNPGDDTATIYLYERPLGGVVRSTFRVDGTLHEVGCARVSNRYLIGAYDLPPRSQSEMHVQTMADGGSAYPLEVGVTMAEPLPTTPPIDAPDGCFPKPAPSATPATMPSPPGVPVTAPSAMLRRR